MAEATQRVLGSLSHAPSDWTILGRSNKFHGAAVSCSVKGDEATALKAWQMKFPDYTPVTMSRTVDGRREAKKLNEDWKFTGEKPIAIEEVPRRRRRRRTSTTEVDSTAVAEAVTEGQPAPRRRRRRRRKEAE